MPLTLLQLAAAPAAEDEPAALTVSRETAILGERHPPVYFFRSGSEAQPWDQSYCD